MDGPENGKKKRRFSKKAACLLLAVVLAAAGGVGGYAWWESQPAQRFAYWEKEGQPPPKLNLVTIYLSDVQRDQEDGHAGVWFSLRNNTQLVKDFDASCWLQYFSERGPYFVWPGKELGHIHLEVGESQSFYVYLPPGTLAMTGQYQFYIENVGQVRFAIFEYPKLKEGDETWGTVLIGEPGNPIY